MIGDYAHPFHVFFDIRRKESDVILRPFGDGQALGRVLEVRAAEPVHILDAALHLFQPLRDDDTLAGATIAAFLAKIFENLTNLSLKVLIYNWIVNLQGTITASY